MRFAEKRSLEILAHRLAIERGWQAWQLVLKHWAAQRVDPLAAQPGMPDCMLRYKTTSVVSLDCTRSRSLVLLARLAWLKLGSAGRRIGDGMHHSGFENGWLGLWRVLRRGRQRQRLDRLGRGWIGRLD